MLEKRREVRQLTDPGGWRRLGKLSNKRMHAGSVGRHHETVLASAKANSIRCHTLSGPVSDESVREAGRVKSLGFKYGVLMGLLAACLFPEPRLMAQQSIELPSVTSADDSSAQAFSPQWLQDHAQELSTRPDNVEEMAEDNPLRSLDYDDFRRIEFDPDAAIWADESRDFTLQLFHPGFYYTIPVEINLVKDGMAQRLPFTTDVFNYSEDLGDIDQSSAEGYAGFRVHHPINTSDRIEEFLVFLGASYFRSTAKGQFYGLSARGLAVDTIGPRGEEFPRFSKFWIEAPEEATDEIVIHALLESESVTGAYHFTVAPGQPTRILVDAHLYPRRDLAHVGIAPLTSMFMFDATNRSRFDDFRNAIHDSDGLQILQANGEQVWRPLANPLHLQASTFIAEEAPVGFGLLQREQSFDHFNDDEARYDKRVSLWIEMLGDWADGHVELVEIPTDEEINDNIVAYWQPSAALQAGESYHFRYRMHWGNASPFALSEGRVVDTATGPVPDSEERIFVIDFSEGRAIPDVMSDLEAVNIQASTTAGVITDVSGKLVDANGRYRTYVKVDPQGASVAELRVSLEVGGQKWGETWLYRWTR